MGSTGRRIEHPPPEEPAPRAASGLLPEPPVLSSIREASEGVVVEHHRQPPFETPEHALLQHLVTVQLGRPIRLQTVADGRSRSWRLVDGDVSVVPARMANKESWDTTTEYAALRLDPGLLSGAVDGSFDAAGVELVPVFGVRDPLVQHVLLALLGEVRGAGGTADRLYVEAMATALCVHLLKHYAASSPRVADAAGRFSRPELRRVAEHVEENFARRNLSLAEMAGEAGMSRYRFSRLFKRATGLSPHQYVIRRRVEEARLLLAHEGLSLCEVARGCGFSDQAHLTRHFKRLVGAAPGEFRRRSKNVQ